MNRRKLSLGVLGFLCIVGAVAANGLQPPSANAPKPTVYSMHSRLFLRRSLPNRPILPLYSKFELTMTVTATYDNPFDPTDIDVHGAFTSPTGKVTLVNGFYYQEYKRQLLDSGREQVTLAGDPVWKVRFTPDEVGKWKYTVAIKDRNRSIQQIPKEFAVIPSADPGFMGVSKKSPGVFAFAGEKPFFAVGENMCWAGNRGTYDFDKWLTDLSAAGGNWIRIWMNNFNTILEGAPGSGKLSADDYPALGIYSLEHAWKLDQILDTAESKGIYTMLCFGTYGELKTGGYFNEGQWPTNPYNAVNGGPCKTAEEFWTAARAKEMYKRRLRYISARYGYRTHIHSWEFWNEADAPAAWISEMADYMKGAGNQPACDPFHHLLSTTYGSDPIWRLPTIDFTMTHSYGTGTIADHAPVVYDDALAHARYHKPHLMAEFGIDWRAPDTKYDPAGTAINLHNGLWGGLASGDAGGAMLWWWDNYISPLHIYAPFTALRHFADKVPWTAAPWRPAKLDPPKSSSKTEAFTDLTIPASVGWGKAANAHFVITPLGEKDHLPISQFLYSPSKSELRTVPAFDVAFAKPGRFSIHVNTVSGSSKVRFKIDGAIVKDIALSATPPADKAAKPEYETTTLVKEYNIYQAVFNKEFAIPVPAGKHTISIENVEGDWTSIESITLSSYRSSRFANLNLYGIVNGSEAVLWVQNASHNWKTLYDKKPCPAVSPSSTVLYGLPAGVYSVEWWDTTKGTVISRSNVSATRTQSGIKLSIPEIKTDIAARVFMASKARN